MPTITIDGKKIECRPGTTIIEAALENGIIIPHFCWHPALSVAGNCRMCLVRVGSYKRTSNGSIEHDPKGNPLVQWIPKLQIACATQVADGMVVDTTGEKTIAAQNAVMEFLLINHPLDCPICDEAGQCKLQEYAFKHSRGESRFTDKKVHKPKRIRWSDRIIFDAERCILCSRCIRFANEIANQPVLTFVERNDHVTIELFEGTEFDSPYSMNVIELCPVGALTSSDFRFKARVWDMSFTPSICPGCARGCNIYIGVRNNEILRLEPRPNLHVNQYWMCDAGRLEQYRWVNTGRISTAIIRLDSGSKSVRIEEALDVIAAAITENPSHTVMVLDGSMSNEDGYVAFKLCHELGIKNLYFVERTDTEFGDNFLRCHDRNANCKGLCAIGIDGISLSDLAQRLNSMKPGILYFVGIDPLTINGQEWEGILKSVKLVIAQLTNTTPLSHKAHIVLPAATYAEIKGTITNVDGRVQLLQPAVETAENLRCDGMAQSRLDTFGAPNDRWTQGERRYCRPHWQLLVQLAQRCRLDYSYNSSEDVFAELANTNDMFHGMTYELIDHHCGLRLGSADMPEPVGIVYTSHFMKPQPL